MADVKIVQENPASFWHLAGGVIMALLGIYIWFNPAVSLMALALYLGIVFIVVGAGYFMASFSFRSGWYLAVGILDILVGVVFVSNLGVSAVSLPIIFALWCMAVGVVQIVTAFQFKNTNFPWYWSLIAGILGVLFAFLILAYPALGVYTITTLMGAYILLYGVVEIIEYFSHRKRLTVNA